MAWLYVPGMPGLSSESGSSSELITEPWLTLSGKPTQRPLSWRGWKTRPWIGHLFGTISRPSTATLGADSWISSLRDIPASHSVPPAAVWDRLTHATSGLTWPAWSEKYDPALSSVKTLTLTFDLDSSKSEET